MAAIGKQYTAFTNDCNSLTQFIVSRLTTNNKNEKNAAVNMLATLSSFICYPTQ